MKLKAMTRRISPDDIDAILPQTQCGLCTHGGCMPYAEAIAYANAPINLCPPGGVPTLRALGNLLQEDVTSHEASMAANAKPPLVAIIREAECIGCTKCIQACPVDAIMGMAKQMHTIIAAECTGCELCIAPCPVDCIDTVPAAPMDIARKNVARTRFQVRENRLRQKSGSKNIAREIIQGDTRKDYVAAAIARAEAKKKGQQ